MAVKQAVVKGVDSIPEQEKSFPESKNAYIGIESIDPELQPVVRDGFEKYKLFKASESRTETLKEQYRDLISPVLMILGDGVGVDLGSDVGKIYMQNTTRGFLNEKKLRGLLLDALMHIPNIGDILTKAFNEATSQTTSTYPMVKMAKEAK